MSQRIAEGFQYCVFHVCSVAQPSDSVKSARSPGSPVCCQAVRGQKTVSLAEETAKEKGEGLSESFACCVLICVYSLNVTGFTGLANHTVPT